MDGRAQAPGEGYVDVDYVHTFFPNLAPLNMALVAALAGVAPPEVDRPFAYLDLGCGHGFTPALIAAAHPHAVVWGNDLNPAHIRSARATAEAAGLDNATFVEASFADLGDSDPPLFDFVAVHGIWSWVGAANRDGIVDLLASRVRPGGLVCVSYNCHAGWDALLPLRRLLVATGGRDGTAAERVARALSAARGVRDAGASYFRDTPAAGALLDTLGHADPAYVAHEYLGGDWDLFQPGDVAAALAPAGLRYVAQARIMDGFDRLWLTLAQQALVDRAEDTAEAEALRDLILARPFRQDLFVRAGERLRDDDGDAWLAARRFVLARAARECLLALTTRTGALDTVPDPGAMLIEMLADGPATGAMLAARTGRPLAAISEPLTMLVAMGHVRPALDVAGEDLRRAATDRFNTAALAGARTGDPAPALASPVSGTGVMLAAGDQILLDAVRCGIPLEAIGGGDGAGGDPATRFRVDVAPMLDRLGIL